MVANPFVDYATLDEAAAATGFGLKVPDTVEGYAEKHISVMSGIMLQVIYKNGDDRLFVRKEKGSEDISGDYNVYSDVTSVAVGGRTVTVKGKDGLYSTAVWTDAGFAYAVMADTPMIITVMSSTTIMAIIMTRLRSVFRVDFLSRISVPPEPGVTYSVFLPFCAF